MKADPPRARHGASEQEQPGGPELLASSGGRQMLNKVPEVTILFWIVKIACTTVGETAADYLNFRLHLGLTGTTLFMIVLLIVV